jgi:hypothetical protein
MSLSNAPKLVKCGMAVIDPAKSGVERVIPLQYNPERLSRSLQARDLGDDAPLGERMRLTGPPVETITLEARIDAIDALERGDPLGVQNGIANHLAALELLLSPTSKALLANHGLSSRGELEILPMLQKLALFIWGRNRVLPVRITQMSITEEDFDPNLNPIRATVSLSLRVMTVDDLGFEDRGGALFLNHLVRKEALSSAFPAGRLNTLGVGDLP